MSEMIKKPDDDFLSYIHEIAERLWSGHAAIMVGAGFSKNAKPNSASCPEFPGWSQLGDLFYEKIHRRKPSTQIKSHCVPKLAKMVQDKFDRPVLNRILRKAHSGSELQTITIT